MKEFFVDVWDVRKNTRDESCPGQLQSQSSAGDLGYVVGVGAWIYLLIHVRRVNYVRAMIIMYNHSSDNVCSSAHTCGYMVDGSVVRIAY